MYITSKATFLREIKLLLIKALTGSPLFQWFKGKNADPASLLPLSIFPVGPISAGV